MSTPSKTSYVTPILLFAVMLLALQWPKIKSMVWPETFPEPAFTWQHDYGTAQKIAQERQQNLLVVFSVSWCPPCKRMKQEVWPDPAVGQAVQASYVPVYIDVDEAKNESLVNQYQVQGIPAIFILDTQGGVVRQANTMSSSDMVGFLTKHVDTSNSGLGHSSRQGE